MAEIITSGHFSVNAGDTFKIVGGVFGSSAYMVQPTFPWVTDWGVRRASKQASQFILDWGAPAPASLNVDYTLVQLS